MAIPTLTKGAVKALLEQREIAGPVVQIVEVRKLQKTDRYRVVLSDGDLFCHGLLANQLNGMLNDEELSRKSVVKLNSWVINPIQGKECVSRPSLIITIVRVPCAARDTDLPQKSIVIILSLTKVSEPLAEVIGTPVSFEVQSKPPGGAAPQTASMPQTTSNTTMMQPKAQYGSSSSSASSAPSGATSYGGGGAGGGKRRITHPINSINPYSGDFVIKARVSARGPMRTWNKGTSSGNLFSVDLVDQEGGEIRATCFNTVADEYFGMFEIGRAFYISKCQIKSSNRKFNPLNHDYELTIDKNSIVEPVDDDTAMPEIAFNFTSIAQIGDVPNESLIDIIAVVKEVRDVVEFTSKAGKPSARREILLADDSNGASSIDCTLWGNDALSFSLPVGSVLLMRRVKVSEYGGRTLSASMSTSMEPNPDIKEAHRLRGWFDQALSSNVQMASLSRPRTLGGGGGKGGLNAPFKTLDQAKNENIGSTKQESFSTKATVFVIKHDNDPWYPACPLVDPNDPKRICQKRLFQKADQWFCERCQQFCKPNFRYMVNFMAVDHTGVTWMTAFDNQGIVMLGNQDAETLMSWKETNHNLYDQIFRDAVFHTFRFGVTARPSTYQDATRVQYGLNSIAPLDFVAESRSLINQIRSYHQ